MATPKTPEEKRNELASYLVKNKVSFQSFASDKELEDLVKKHKAGELPEKTEEGATPTATKIPAEILKLPAEIAELKEELETAKKEITELSEKIGELKPIEEPK
jgi:predicted RNase H-like nuclease (RuvC/YqgF family)